MQAVLDILLKHLDETLTGLVPVIIAFVALKLRSSAPGQVAQVVAEVEREAVGLPSEVKHEMARGKLARTMSGKAAFMVTSVDGQIRDAVANQKRASMVPKEPSK